MTHLLLNFCIMVFVCYATAFPVRAILSGGKPQKRRRAHISRKCTPVHKPAYVKPKRKTIIVPFQGKNAA